MLLIELRRSCYRLLISTPSLKEKGKPACDTFRIMCRARFVRSRLIAGGRTNGWETFSHQKRRVRAVAANREGDRQLITLECLASARRFNLFNSIQFRFVLSNSDCIHAEERRKVQWQSMVLMKRDSLSSFIIASSWLALASRLSRLIHFVFIQSNSFRLAMTLSQLMRR